MAGSLKGGEEGGVEKGGLEVAQPWGDVAGHPTIFYIQDSNNISRQYDYLNVQLTKNLFNTKIRS